MNEVKQDFKKMLGFAGALIVVFFLLVVGIIVAIIVGLIMGMKFILGSLEEKAEIKTRSFFLPLAF